MKEEELIKAIARGEESALSALYQLYYERLVRFLYRLTADKEHIIEIVNDIFLVVWKNADSFRGDSAVSTWVLGIAYKKGLQSVSRHKKFRSLDEDTPNLHDEHDRFVAERNTAQLFQRLTPEHRAVMELTYYFGYSYKEIGEIMDCPENTVKTRMFYGRQHLRQLLEDKQYA